MDAGVGFADPSIVDRITRGVDVTGDNATHRLMSPTNTERTSLAVEKCFTAVPGALAPHGPQLLVGAVAGQ